MSIPSNAAGGDEAAVQRLLIKLFWLSDERRWDELTEVFTDEVHLDYTSLNGGAPATLRATEIVAAWQAALGGLDAHQHLVSNVLVDLDGDTDGGTASATAQFQATHTLSNRFGDDTWVLGGHYTFDLMRDRDPTRREGSGWRVRGMTMTATWGSGNQQIMSLAAARAPGRDDASRAGATVRRSWSAGRSGGRRA